jgi:hypothetical protein
MIRALGRLFVAVLGMVWHEPVEFFGAMFDHYFGDREKAGRRFRALNQRQMERIQRRRSGA